MGFGKALATALLSGVSSGADAYTNLQQTEQDRAYDMEKALELQKLKNDFSEESANRKAGIGLARDLIKFNALGLLDPKKNPLDMGDVGPLLAGFDFPPEMALTLEKVIGSMRSKAAPAAPAARPFGGGGAGGNPFRLGPKPSGGSAPSGGGSIDLNKFRKK